MPKRIERPEKERAALALKIERDLQTLRRAGHVGDLHESHVGNVAHALSFYLEDSYSFGALELAACELVSPSTILKTPASGSPEERKAKEAERAANPTRDDYARMSASERLEAINAREHREREVAASEAAKLDSGHSLAELKGMKPSARLSLANEWRKLGAESEPKAPSAEQLRKMDAARRLDVVNAQIEASRKNASALAKRLKAAKENAE